MVKAKDQVKILFVQVRGDEMKEHEFLCFDRAIDVPQENFLRVDVFRDDLHESLLEGVDVVILAGTGHYFSGGGHPEKLPQLIEFIKTVRERHIPLLGIGYGHEVIAMAFGGEVVQDPSLREIGSIQMHRTEAGKTDRIFQHLPDVFRVQIGHNHSVNESPVGAVELVSSEKVCCEAFTFPGEPLYALQFHPELDHPDVVIRLQFYQRKYLTDAAEVETIVAGLRHSPDAAKILDLFIDEVVLS
ncbi:MAG: gamma-glutamyl-gamma-aminobutyrate hydrolase family protein [Candidatus Uhrbacteria bacterium]|nr:gamma-glutamyl-gamma-aminobutyrate hydrolase family protein [Patescibacteria group bacterium]MBU1906857.1 gamma-glutamyl-gamma-aminobutyrate hydrolase family protein [Patescibacteria group bacterium]